MTTPPLSRRTLLAAGTLSVLGPHLPSAASAQPATPVSITPGGASGGGSLPAMLTLVTTPPTEGGGPPLLRFAYADIQRQLEVRGLRGLAPAMDDDDRLGEWSVGVDGLWLDDLVIQWALQSELWGAVGFSPADVTQTMTLGDPPSIVRLYRGAFDGEAVARALDASGYERIESAHGPVWSIGAEAEIDLAHPVQRLVISAYNNLAVVDDELVVSSPYLAAVEATLAVIAGDAPSLRSDRAVVELLAAAKADLVSAALLGGPFLADPARVLLEGDDSTPTAAAAGTIPPISLALFGITAGSMAPRTTDADDPLEGDHDDDTPRSDLVITVKMSSAGTAAVAVPLIERRLARGRSLVTGRPYADEFRRWRIETAGDGSIVRLVISGDRVGRRWRELILQRDLGFLTTG